MTQWCSAGTSDAPVEPAEEALQRALKRMELLARTAGELLQASEPQNVVDRLCQQVMEHLGCQAFLNFLVEGQAGRLHLNACAGVPAEVARRVEWLDHGVAVCGCAARDGCRIVAEHIGTTPDPRTDLVRSCGIRAYACHPLLGPGGAVLGTLSFGTRDRDAFSDDDLSLMRAVADQVAVAMVRVHDQHSLHQLNAELEQRVQERTAELLRRAEQLARLASDLTLVEERERRRLASVLHDHLQQLLVGGKLGLEALSRRLEGGVLASVRQVQRLLDESLEVSRSLTVDLSPPILHEAGLRAGLQWLVRWVQQKQALSVELDAGEVTDPGREDLRVLLFQATRELLLNVRKHSGVNEARVELAQCGDGDLQLVVSDAGAGFDPEDMWGTGKHASGGFGLFSIRERLGLLGGRLEIQSAPGAGTRITLTAPMRRARTAVRAGVAAEDGAAAGARVLSEAGSDGPTAGPQVRVLLVDDHVVMRQGLSLLLQGESDIEVVGEASDGAEAVREAGLLLPDVVLMDFSMPRMDGVEATRRIHAEMPRIRIIGLSMYEEADRAAAMLGAGAVAYMSKSGSPEALLGAIRSAAAS